MPCRTKEVRSLKGPKDNEHLCQKSQATPPVGIEDIEGC